MNHNQVVWLLVAFKKYLETVGEAVGDTDSDTAEAFLRKIWIDDVA